MELILLSVVFLLSVSFSTYQILELIWGSGKGLKLVDGGVADSANKADAIIRAVSREPGELDELPVPNQEVGRSVRVFPGTYSKSDLRDERSKFYDGSLKRIDFKQNVDLTKSLETRVSDIVVPRRASTLELPTFANEVSGVKSLTTKQISKGKTPLKKPMKLSVKKTKVPSKKSRNKSGKKK